jgi:predicted lipoprotein with Yx(FWY)xxD motif
VRTPLLPVAAAAIVAACGSSGGSGAPSHGTASPSGSPTASPSASPTASKPDTSSATVAAASVPGVGMVLVNGFGRTYYVLSSEAGGRITCTDDNGCTQLWPDSELPAGVPAPIAGAGIQKALLGTVKAADGGFYVTYAGYPLYTYARDEASGQAHGQGIQSFGGTWEAMRPDGTPVTGGQASP